MTHKNTDIIATPRHSPEISRLIRLEFEKLARKLERRAGSDIYRTAWRTAARVIRESKPD